MPKNYAVLDILGTVSLKTDQSANREVEKRLLKILEAKKFESMQQYVAQSRSLKNTAARQHLQPVTGLLQPKTMSALKERFGGARKGAGHLRRRSLKRPRLMFALIFNVCQRQHRPKLKNLNQCSVIFRDTVTRTEKTHPTAAAYVPREADDKTRAGALALVI